MEDEKRDNRLGFWIRSPTIKGALQNHLMRAVRFAAFNTTILFPSPPTRHTRPILNHLNLHLQCHSNYNLYPTIPRTPSGPTHYTADTYLDFSGFFFFPPELYKIYHSRRLSAKNDNSKCNEKKKRTKLEKQF